MCKTSVGKNETTIGRKFISYKIPSDYIEGSLSYFVITFLKSA